MLRKRVAMLVEPTHFLHTFKHDRLGLSGRCKCSLMGDSNYDLMDRLRNIWLFFHYLRDVDV